MKILIADDDLDLLMALYDWLKSRGHDVVTAADGSAALAALDQGVPELAFLDIEMPGKTGMDVLRRMRARHADLTVIIMTGHGTIARAVDAMKDGAADFITKPLDFAELESVMAKALDRHRVGGEIARLLGEISHDVKNLLMPVVCGSDLLESEIGDLVKRLPAMEALKTEESQRLCAEVIEMLRHTAKRIQERTKNIADYIKLSHAPVAFAPCRLAEVVDNVLKILRLPADVKHVALRAEGLDRLPVIQADELRLYAVFYNLINNAIPEVPPGGSVTVGGTAAGDAVTLTVSDTGRGMPPEVREKLFTSRSASRKAGGSGIGMQIVKDAVDSHGGEIRVESAEGKGTTFTIRLPLAPAG